MKAENGSEGKEDEVAKEINNKILQKEVLSLKDVREFMEASLKASRDRIKVVQDKGVSNYLNFSIDRHLKALNEWDTTRDEVLSILLLSVFYGHQLQHHTSVEASKKCIKLLMSEPLITSKNSRDYEIAIKDASGATERARGNPAFMAFRTWVAGLEYNAEKFTLLYGRANRNSRLRMREDKFNTLLERLNQ